MNNTLPNLLAAAVRARGPHPLLTFSNSSQSSRTELSYATFANWAAKTANWLVAEHVLERGDRVEVATMGDWRFCVALAGCWLAGVGPVLAGDGIVADDEVLAYADDYDDPDVNPDDAAVIVGSAVTTHTDLLAAAADLLPGRARLVATAAAGTPVAVALAGVVAAQGHLIWSPGLDTRMARRLADQERATHVLEDGGAVEL